MTRNSNTFFSLLRLRSFTVLLFRVILRLGFLGNAIDLFIRIAGEALAVCEDGVLVVFESLVAIHAL